MRIGLTIVKSVMSMCKNYPSGGLPWDVYICGDMMYPYELMQKPCEPIVNVENQACNR